MVEDGPVRTKQSLSYEDAKTVLAAWKRIRIMSYMLIGLCLLGIISVVAIYLTGIGIEEFDYAATLAGITALLVLSVCLLSRKPLGRFISFFLLILLLVGFPIGTLIGVFGLFGVWRGRSLYMADGPTPDELQQLIARVDT